VTNIGRVHVLPWSRVVTVRQNLTLGFELDDGRRIAATGVTAPRGRGLMLGGLTKGQLGVGSEDFHRNADALRPLQAEAARTDAPVVSRWDVVLTLGCRPPRDRRGARRRVRRRPDRAALALSAPA
jgi:hypothetical protein